MSPGVGWRHRALLALYPPSFRERYGDELRGLVEDSAPSSWMALDLAVGAGRAWTRPRFGGTPQQRRRARLLASILTVFWSWSLVLLALAAFTRTVDDPAVAGLRQTLTHTAFRFSQISIDAATALIMAGGIIYGVAIAVTARRQRTPRLLLPATIPVAAGLAWLGMSAVLGWWLLHYANGHRLPLAVAAALVVVLLAWFFASVALLPTCWVSVTVAMRRAQLSLGWLRPGLVGAAAVAVALAVAVVSMAVTAASLADSGGLAPTGVNILAGYCIVPIAALASAIALVSAGRGMRSLRDPGPLAPGQRSDGMPTPLSPPSRMG